jgi:hypothetical protein
LQFEAVAHIYPLSVIRQIQTTLQNPTSGNSEKVLVNDGGAQIEFYFSYFAILFSRHCNYFVSEIKAVAGMVRKFNFSMDIQAEGSGNAGYSRCGRNH